jgi:ubiquinone/menaquinone biosynthesis C-methylase UbiE
MNDEAGRLAFTGERFIPGTRGEIWIEHWHRYHFASRWSAGRRVLDIACGEGYGSALLARNAAHVTGVDVSLEAIEHAREAYGSARNLEFRSGSCTHIPLPDGSVDLVVSFETIEHIEGQEAFLDEVARVLTPDGVLLASCPNKEEYSDKREFSNEFHVKELYREELDGLLRPRFAHADWYGQRPTFYSIIAPERPAPWAGQLVEVTEDQPDSASARLSSPLYFIVAAARERAALSPVAPTLSVFADRTDWMYQDYVSVVRDLNRHAALNKELEKKLAEKEAELARARQWPWWMRWLGK